ncbi:MAG: phospho-sugar mutase, partial [Firmicutes bacterium]|nr:phospho-sugar mutase [Bacillota bacterium]
MTLDAWERFHSWMNDEKIDEETKNELQSIRANDEEVYDRFYKTLEFGTGGLRGKIGAGANRLNIYTIRLASQAFANVLIKKGRSSQGVVIAYDSRNWSREFAHEAAKVMIGNGIPVHIFDDIAPTPMLSFAVRHIGAGAGIMITASHNSPEYNGFKAFDEKGVQLLDDLALAVSDQMKTLSLSDVRVESQPDVHPLWHVLGEETYQAYF